MGGSWPEPAGETLGGDLQAGVVRQGRGDEGMTRLREGVRAAVQQVLQSELERPARVSS